MAEADCAVYIISTQAVIAVCAVLRLVLEGWTQGLAAAGQRGISLTVLPWEGAARFDSKWTAEALYNVLDNALKYTPPGGTVTLSVTAYHMFCCIQVSDTGPGIPEEELPFVKQKFYKGSSKARGSGIGLAVCDEIVRLHGGTFDIANAEGGGAVVTISLPMS